MHTKTVEQRQERYPAAFVRFMALGLIPAFVPGAVIAQFRDCDAADSRCLDDIISTVCMARQEPWPGSCEAMLDELMQYPDSADEPEILSHAGLASLILGQGARSDADASKYLATAETLYRQVIAIDPDHADAYLGLAQTTDDPAEQVEWLRESALAGESGSMRYRFLADALERQGTRESRLESAAIMREAYENEPSGRHKWYLAGVTLSKYSLLGLDAEASELRASVSAAIDFDGLLGSVTSAELEPEASIEVLDTLCYEDVVAIFGADDCITGAESLFAAAIRAEDPMVSQQLAQAGLERIRAAPYGSGGSMDRVEGVVEWLERLAQAGIDSRELDFAMGRCYLDLGRSRDALAAFERASAFPDRGWREYLSYYVEVARDLDAASAREQHFCVERDTITVH